MHIGSRKVCHVSISNLSIFGFSKFYKYFYKCGIRTTFVYVPRMMAPYVLDADSKNNIIDDIDFSLFEFKNM